MASEKLKFSGKVKIARSHWDVPVRVGLRPYMQFNRWLDGELEKLVARWSHTAAPNAARFGRRKR